jgi:hypothetical protein
MRYDVDPMALRDGAASVETVIAQVQRLAVGTVLGPVAVALPGSRSAAALRQVVDAWELRLGETRDELRELGRGLSMAATTYERADQTARDLLSGAAGPPR